MATLKQRLEELLEETEQLRETAERQAQVSEDAISGLENLRSEIERAQDNLSTLSARVFDRFAASKRELEKTFKEASNQILGSILVGSIVGQAISQKIAENSNNPQTKMARKCYNVVQIIGDSMNSGDRLDRDGFIELLVMHEFSREEATYFIDRLINKYEALLEYETDDGTPFLAIDPEGEFAKNFNEAIDRKQLPYF